jgi:heat shock protein HslJ
VAFAETDLSGSGGCNQMGGTYTAADGDIAVSDLFSTQMACEPAIMEQEAAFTARMTGATTYSSDAGTLTIDGDEGSIVFSAVA